MEKELPKRKRNRWEGYDYSLDGAYFITICTKDRKNLFWENEFDLQNYDIDVGANCVRPKNLPLSEFGQSVYEELEIWNQKYENVEIDYFVIMPNHIHLIVAIFSDEGGEIYLNPTVSRMVKQFKGKVSKILGQTIWQRSFYDRVIRNATEYEKIRQYMYENPLKWTEDELYV